MRFSQIISISFVLLVGCEEKTTQDTSSLCVAPVAEAGSDFSMAFGQPVTLDGSASTWCDALSENINPSPELFSIVQLRNRGAEDCPDTETQANFPC